MGIHEDAVGSVVVVGAAGREWRDWRGASGDRREWRDWVEDGVGPLSSEA